MTNNLEVKAKDFAYNAHFGQTRKGKDTPFVTHLDSVVSIVKVFTADEQIIAAAWLHDVVEDTPTEINTIYKEFGEIVGDYVSIETEDKLDGQSSKSTWLARKEEQLNRLMTDANDNPKILLIAFADKLANLREMNADYAIVGNDLWSRFNNTNLKEQGWYYSEFLKTTKHLKVIKDSELSEEMKNLIAFLFE